MNKTICEVLVGAFMILTLISPMFVWSYNLEIEKEEEYHYFMAEYGVTPHKAVWDKLGETLKARQHGWTLTSEAYLDGNQNEDYLRYLIATVDRMSADGVDFTVGGMYDYSHKDYAK